MNLFLSAHPDDADYLSTFSPLVKSRSNVTTNFKLEDPSSLAALQHWLRFYKSDALIITNPTTLGLVLYAQPDFTPPNGRKELTLNDYQGSFLELVVDGRTIPAVVLNPLQHLVTVPYGKFLAERFLSKILSTERWLPDIPFQWQVVTIQEKDNVVRRLSSSRLIAADIETPTSGEWSDVRGINCVGYAGLYHSEASGTRIECYVFPFDDWAYASIRDINDSAVPKVTQNGLYDNLYFMRWGLPVRCWYWDTYHLFHSWLAELPKNLALVTAFGVRRVRFWKDDGKSGNLEDYYRYNARDCWATLCALLSLLRDAPEWAVTNYTEHEFPLVFPCITCELEGIRVDEPEFQKFYKQKYEDVLKDLHTIQTMVGSPLDPLPLKQRNVRNKDTGEVEQKDAIQFFNPGSHTQLGALFKLLGVGHLGSTDKAATLKARAAHPLCDVIIGACAEWKSDRKIVGNYFNDNKLWQLGPDSYRLFYKLDPGGTDSGRLASRASSFWCGFQIQNIPAKDIAVKQCLVADAGWLLGEGDYAQSEARCVGYLSGETKLIEVVEGPNDYHAYNASQFFGVPYERIYDNGPPKKTLDKPLRDLSKRTNHGANYNMGAGVMLDTMGPKYVAEAKRLLRLPLRLPLKAVCQYLLEVYEKTYPKVKGDWYASIVKAVTISGLLVSPLGWTRKCFGKPRENKQHLNSYVAHGPQNLSVGIINKQFRKIWQDQIYGDLKGKIRIKAQIHDSILFQFRVGCNEVPSIVQERMRVSVPVTDCFGVTRNMVIPPDMSAGKKRWSELK